MYSQNELSIWQAALPYICNSVRLSVRRVLCIKTAERIIEILSLSDRPIILVFITKGCCVNLTDSLLTGAALSAEYKGIAIFDQYLGNGNR